MSDAATDTTTDTDTGTDDTATGSDDTEPDWKAEAEKAKAAATKWEARAKGNHTAVKELDNLKRSTMSDLEKAKADARDEGRAEAIKEAATQLVDAKFEAAAAGKIPVDKLPKVLAGINRAAFIGDDGQINTKAIGEYVDAIAPAKGAPDFGQGQRGSAAPADFNATIRQRMGR